MSDFTLSFIRPPVTSVSPLSKVMLDCLIRLLWWKRVNSSPTPDRRGTYYPDSVDIAMNTLCHLMAVLGSALLDVCKEFLRTTVRRLFNSSGLRAKIPTEHQTRSEELFTVLALRVSRPRGCQGRDKSSRRKLMAGRVRLGVSLEDADAPLYRYISQPKEQRSKRCGCRCCSGKSEGVQGVVQDP